MKLSIIICCYNAGGTLAETLEAFVEETWSEPWEIIVVDNRSTDNSAQIVKQYQKRLPNLRKIDARERQGKPYASNVGVQMAAGEYIAFCDADDVVERGWVAAMGEALSKHDFVAARMETEKLNVPWVCKSRGTPQSEGLQRYHYPPYLPHAGGSTIGCKRELYLSVGGFDESFSILEDTDFCWRVQRVGVQLHFVPEAMLHVRYRTSFSSLYRQSKSYGYYNVLLYKRYRQYGMPRISRKQGVKAWIKLVKRIPQIHSKGELAKWVRDFAWRVGRLESSIKNNIFSL